MLVGLDWLRIKDALTMLEAQPRGEDYQMPNVSDKVVRIVMSYTDYVNRVVWHKN